MLHIMPCKLGVCDVIELGNAISPLGVRWALHWDLKY